MNKNFYQVVIFSVVLFCVSFSVVGLPIKGVSAKSIGNTVKESVDDLLPPLAPVANTPVYYCQNATAVALTATPDTGNTLIWYGTSATGGTPSATAPTPSTTTVGSFFYYVSQTDGATESPRTQITVNVVADNGAIILGLTCDASQIAAADKASSVFFDWENNSLISNTYNYTYSIQGGSPVSGSIIVSHLQVFGMLPGQSATMTLTSATHPCVPAQTLTCSVPCGAILIAPDFASIAALCSGDVAPALGTTSPNGIVGTWSPAVVSNTQSGTYVFTPNANQCASSQSLNVAVNPASPGFSSFAICQGDVAPTLATTSPNGVIGSWLPMTVDNQNTADYTFTPDAGQCASPETITVTVKSAGSLIDFDWAVTEAFSDNQVITVTPLTVATTRYLYQLDFGPFQDSPVFEEVSYGLHSITVKDEDGCSAPVRRTGLLVVNYPRVFTPNGDGFYDTWNVSTLRTDLTSTIKIFDRYGKFLIEIAPKGNGWDGNYNGRLMPSTDYWFVINYEENGVQKIYRSHFALKR
ncbi:hypothetical protein FFWV33_11595 [Flavobacterium faecale]|uniref:Ig-like domain-containing protein n=1 Tax=Flavobacterium faecale TaxID=1355330 RepID=A0A2S1LEH2_9FLAO|nr:T9SS type B sorting domain-containing protein [Flavobacterium faecale]AWG22108.1 hypothetical protein FFWV33_11595 [Flavobacterium faecale]